MIWRVMVSIFVFIGIVGCAYRPNVDMSQSVSMVLKTPDLRVADVGFIRSTDDYINVQLFNAANLVLDLQLQDTICINGSCLDKMTFNQRFLKEAHYPTLMEEILRFQPIYRKQTLEKTNNGFRQVLHVKGRTITYELKNETIIYRDKAKHILIKITALKGK